jgi:N-acetylglucosamine kinase-like BadF-type ATPase
VPSVIGFDGGGSRCAAFWVDHEGRVLGHGVGGSTHEWYGLGSRAADSVDEALGPMLGEQSERPDLGMFTSPGGESPFLRFAELIHPSEASWCGEPDVQWAAARLTHGLMLLTGTGSHVQGRAPDGRVFTLGGAGPVIGDQGSGFDIGILAIARSCLAEGLPRLGRDLAEAVKAHLGAEKRWDLVTIFHQRDPGRQRIAGLAPVVCRLAEQGDAAALAVLDEAARHIAVIARCVVEEMKLEGERDVLFAGGVSRSPAYRAALSRHLTPLFEEEPRYRTVRYPPAVGAALLGFERLGAPLTEEAHSRLAQELEGLGFPARKESC